MCPTGLSYDDLKQEVESILRQNRQGVLATAKGDFVTARMVMLLADGLTLYGFSGFTTRKFIQMRANTNVAIGIANLQIEGVATLKGAPLEPENAGFMKLLQEQRPEILQFWGKLFEQPGNGMRVFEIAPRRVGLYRVQNPPYLDILDIPGKTATRIDVPGKPGDIEYRQF
jgi:uncharacterized pyridoxamine 5'-phosphate oxidase family protein